MKQYTHIFFDLDRTLWDFDKNSAETLHELYKSYKLEKELGIEEEVFISSFKELNAQAWRNFRNGSKSKEEMRDNRFVETFFKYGSSDWKIARKMSRDYIEICPYKPNLIEGALELLENLKNNFKLHLITNGFSDTQRVKIISSGIKQFFSEMIISEETSYRKPQREIFIHAVNKAKTTIGESIMVGDDWKNDIQGAKRAGMDQIYFNPLKKAVLEEGSTTHEVEKLLEIATILQS